MGGLHRDFISLLKTFSTAYSETLRTSAGILPLGGSHKDLFSLFRTFNTDYSGTLTTSTAFGKIVPRPLRESEFAYGRSEASPASEHIELKARKCKERNYASVEQIKERVAESRVRGKKVAFTLAEVLITLGIIGVVAAMTLPTLIANHKRQETVVRLKKIYTTVSQAFKMSQVDNDEYANWEIPDTASEYINKYFMPYLNGAKLCTTYSECGYKSLTPFVYLDGTANTTIVARDDLRLPVIFNDGMIALIGVASGSADGQSIVKTSTIFFDINGSKGPNKFGYDVFSFTLTSKGIVSTSTETCEAGANGYACGGVIMKNSWEIPKDYPIKF